MDHFALILLSGLLLFGCGSSVAIAALVFGRQLDAQWARPFGLLALSVAFLTAVAALELNSDGLEKKVVWSAAQYLSTGTIPVFYFVFAAGYTERPWARSPFLKLLFVVPFLSIVFLWFDIGDLVYASVRLVPTALGPNLNADYGWWFWVHVVHSYVLLGLGVLQLGRAAIRRGRGYARLQLALLASCVILPVLGNALTIFDVFEVDLTPILTGAMVLVMGGALFRLRLFTIIPTRMAVLEKMEEGFLSIDQTNRVIDFNLSAQEIFGLSDGELRHKKLGELNMLPEETRGVLTETGYVGRLETTLPRQSDTRHYALYVSHLARGQGRENGRLILLRDITQRRQLEQLQQDLTRAMVHDLRSPVSTSIQLVELLLDEWKRQEMSPGWRRETLQRTSKILRSALYLIERTLELQRMENGQLKLQYEILSVNELIRYIEPVIRPLSQRKKVEVVTELADSLPPVCVDRLSIARVIQNLLDNSIKFSPTGGQVVLEARPKTNNGHPQMLISVRDNGPGIPDDLRLQLFQKFARGSHTEQGFGLGLAFCKTILEAHGESIWVEASSPRGTVITFSLPVAAGGGK